jgi:hypothetical protein
MFLIIECLELTQSTQRCFALPVASCQNASASLFFAAKMAHLGQLTQGHPERAKRANAMQERMKQEGFGS